MKPPVGGGPGSRLPGAGSVLAVCAHPDDESFGLGAALSHFASAGSEVAVVCFTHGEASTLGMPGPALGDLRRRELTSAAAALGVGRVELLDHPDGGLGEVALGWLADPIARLAREHRAELLLVFDEGGVTGHADHQRATEAALAAAPGLPVLAWSIDERVALALNAEFGASFIGRRPTELDIVVELDRARQHRAIACHASQAGDNAVLRRRLELQGTTETFRWLRSPSDADQAMPG